MMLSCENLSVSRQDRTVLSDISFQADQPELIGVIGPNGAGKTTLMRSLIGLQDYTGQVYLKGADLTILPPTLRAQQIAYLPQERSLHWPLKCRDVVMLGRMPHQSKFGSPSHQDEVVTDAVMTEMGVSQFADRSFDQISGGEQARVLIARVLAQQTDILLADEPTSGLDPAHQIDLMQTFKEQARRGKTVMTSLHDLSLASRWCDRILVLNKGILAADGPPSEVLTDQILSDIFGVTAARVTVGKREIILPYEVKQTKNG